MTNKDVYGHTPRKYYSKKERASRQEYAQKIERQGIPKGSAYGYQGGSDEPGSKGSVPHQYHAGSDEPVTHKRKKDVKEAFHGGFRSPGPKTDLQKSQNKKNADREYKGFNIKRDKGGQGFSMVIQKKIKGFEETEMSDNTINELSKPLLKRAVKGFAKKIGKLHYSAGVRSDVEGGMHDLDKSDKYEKGISKAVHRIGGKYYPKHVAKRNPTFGGHRKYKGAHSEAEFTDPKTGKRYPRSQGRTGPYRADESVDEGLTVSTKGYTGSRKSKPENRVGTKGFINFKGGKPAAEADHKVLAYHKAAAAKEGKVVQLRYRGPRSHEGRHTYNPGASQIRGSATGAAIYYKDKSVIGGRQRQAARDERRKANEEYEMDEGLRPEIKYSRDITDVPGVRGFRSDSDARQKATEKWGKTAGVGQKIRAKVFGTKMKMEEYEMNEDEDEGEEQEVMEPDVSELVMSAIEQKPLDFQQSFADLMQQRIEDAVAEKKLEVASVFTDPEGRSQYEAPDDELEDDEYEEGEQEVDEPESEESDEEE